MFALLCFVLAVLASPFKSKSRLEAENAALRHQLIVLRRKVQGRTRLTNNDRWGVVRLTNHDLADHDRSGLSRCKLTPLGQSGRTVLFEDMAAVEVTVVVEVVVDRGVRGGKFLQGFDVPELRH